MCCTCCVFSIHKTRTSENKQHAHISISVFMCMYVRRRLVYTLRSCKQGLALAVRSQSVSACGIITSGRRARRRRFVTLRSLSLTFLFFIFSLECVCVCACVGFFEASVYWHLGISDRVITSGSSGQTAWTLDSFIHNKSFVCGGGASSHTNTWESWRFAAAAAGDAEAVCVKNSQFWRFQNFFPILENEK